MSFKHFLSSVINTIIYYLLGSYSIVQLLFAVQFKCDFGCALLRYASRKFLLRIVRRLESSRPANLKRNRSHSVYGGA